MGPEKDNDSKVKRKMTRITIEVKKEIIATHENGVLVTDLATCKNMGLEINNEDVEESYGKNSFGLRTFRVTNGLQERIKFVNQGSTVYHDLYCHILFISHKICNQLLIYY
jgi:hypothetical protein